MTTHTTPKKDPDGPRWAPHKTLWLSAHLAVWAAFGFDTATPGALAVFVLLSVVTLCLGHSVGLHRGLIHRAYRTSRGLERALVYLGVLAGMGGPRGMMRMHTLRDVWQSSPSAPDYYRYDHGPLTDHIWYVHCEHPGGSPDDPAVRHAMEHDAELAADPFFRRLERWWRWQQLPLAIALFALGGFGWVVWGVCARVAVAILGHWVVNYHVHTTGYRSHHIGGVCEQGYNSLIFGAISFGEGWHNNHHASPRSARMGQRWWELDLGYACVWTLERLGLVWDVRRS